MHKITVRNNPEAKDKLTTGHNTQVLLDGQLLKGCSFFKFEVKAAKMAKVTIEMYATIDLEVNADLEKSAEEPTDLTLCGNTVNVYTLSSLYPAIVATKK